jgi:hypothetical protein
MATPTTTISGLPQTVTTLNDAYYLPVDTSSFTGKMQASVLKTYISSGSLTSITAGTGIITNGLHVGSLIVDTTVAAGAISATSVTTTKDVTVGGNLVIVGTETLGGQGTFYSNLAVAGNIASGGQNAVTQDASGNVSIGNITVSGNATIGSIYALIRAPYQPYIATLSNVTTINANVTGTLTVMGATTVYNNIVPSSNAAAVSLGTSTNWFTNIYGTAIHAQYADLAECYESDVRYPAGTVVVFGDETEVTISTTASDTRVAGVVSTNPAYLMNEGTGGLPIALQGRVPCQVTGTVKRGDLMVTSDIPGVAMANNNPPIGTVIGKALGTFSGSEVGVIEVVVGRI